MCGTGFVPVAQRLGVVVARRATVPDVDENEVRLGELIFSTRDPRMEVATAPELYGDEFCAFVNAKAEKSDDIEERVALKSLVDMITQTRKAIEEKLKEEELEAAAQEEMMSEMSSEVAPLPKATTTAEVLAAANNAVGGSRVEAVEPSAPVAVEAGLSGDALRTYDALLGRLLAADAAGALGTEVEASFEQCDYALLTLAASRRDRAEDPSPLARVIEAVNALSAERLESAAQRLQSVLRAGGPKEMMQKIVELSARGAIDTPMIELLEANRQQAEAAGPAGEQAADLMRRLADKCRQELDRRVGEKDPEKRLLRALLRCGDDLEARDRLLRRAFEPREEIELSFDGRKTEGGPDVEPPKFIAACSKLIAEFGNVDDGTGKPLADSIRALAEQAEAVAIELYGETNTPRDQQDRMWKEGTTSVFDLEAAEFAAESKGERMPWQNDQYDDMLPPGFDHETGVKRIGGS
ncbi:hypothetical protein CTAYLR_010156 [Chrysophaeum taylorii]|uniref:Uncharacterized protein n=1 Tax=Chrysophaeum taylorii TaxID=2483200 RepID=A0AAD7U8K3_9STRA|nr:hypothetical protein CTAYLR_010156 [Chrysophaeum taylorii]